MKKRILKIVLTAALTLLLPVLLLCRGAALPEFYQQSYYAQLPRLVRRLEETPGKRIIVLGGSNVAFGLDGALMEQLLGEHLEESYTVCPFGFYGALGVDAMLSLSRDLLREGDVVVLAMEPAQQSLSTYFGATVMWKCAEEAPELLLKLDREQQGAMVGNYLPYLQERISYQESGTVPQVQGVYARDSFDDRCDMVYDRAGNAMALGYDTAVTVDFGAITLEEPFVTSVNDYITAAQRRGASVCLSFSPVNRVCLTGPAEGIYDYFLQCNSSFLCPVISDPRDYVMDSGWFYDSNFHLNSAGARHRTVTLTRDVLAYLGCYEAVEVELPEMPASIAVTQQEPSAQTADFLFRPLSNPDTGAEGYEITGLTEQGMGKASLTVPASYEGRPVVGFTAEAFAGNTTLQSLTLPESVESIPDNAFAGCQNLTRLVLLHGSKLCTVGQAPFAGAENLKIYVPSAAYSMYREGVGCAINPWEAYLEQIVAF